MKVLVLFVFCATIAINKSLPNDRKGHRNMKNQRRSIVMVLFLMISIFSVCSIAQAEAEQPPYTYLNLDYATVTADDAAEVLLTEKGVILNVRPKR